MTGRKFSSVFTQEPGLYHEITEERNSLQIIMWPYYIERLTVLPHITTNLDFTLKV